MSILKAVTTAVFIISVAFYPKIVAAMAFPVWKDVLVLKKDDDQKFKCDHMRKVIFGINLTLDGCCDHTKVSGNEEIHEYFAQHIRDADVLVYGRKTYQLMVPFWPDVAKSQSGQTKAINDFAQAFDGVNQIIVFSRTLEKVEGENTRIVRGNLKDEILKLKQEPGRDILVGGVDLPSQLIELDLIDEYRFVIHPRVVGEGRRLLDGNSLHEKLQLKLVDSKIFTSGCVALQYIRSV